MTDEKAKVTPEPVSKDPRQNPNFGRGNTAHDTNALLEGIYDVLREIRDGKAKK